MSERMLTPVEIARLNDLRSSSNPDYPLQAAYDMGRSDERAEHKCKLPDSIEHALNSGDGSYRP